MACRILVVEDELLVRQFVASALGLRGYEVETCPTGETGLYQLKTCLYDVLLTDYHMPRMTGIQLIEGMRAAKLSIATILMSGNTKEELELTQKDLEGVEFLRKPFGIDDLYESVRRALKSTSR